MEIAMIFIGSALVGGFVGAYAGYITMYKCWRLDKDDFFKQQAKKKS
jgi:hypothetical protein